MGSDRTLTEFVWLAGLSFNISLSRQRGEGACAFQFHFPAHSILGDCLWVWRPAVNWKSPYGLLSILTKQASLSWTASTLCVVFSYLQLFWPLYFQPLPSWGALENDQPLGTVKEFLASLIWSDVSIFGSDFLKTSKNWVDSSKIWGNGIFPPL